MTVFIALLLAILSFAIISFPFFKSRARTAGVDRDEYNRELSARRETTYAMLKELESDYQSGILNQEEYTELEKTYRQRADAIAGDINRAGKTPGADDEIEQKVLELRGKKSKPKSKTAPFIPKTSRPEDEIERQVQKLRQKKGLVCSKCGKGYREGDRFCPQCGAPLGRGGQH